MRMASSISSCFERRGISPGLFQVEPQGVVSDRLDREVESRLGGLQDALADWALLVYLYGLVEELRVQILYLFHSHVELFYQRHDLVAGDVAALLAYLEEVLHVHYGADVNGGDVSFSLHCCLLS